VKYAELTFEFPGPLTPHQEEVLVSYVANAQDALYSRVERQITGLNLADKVAFGSGKSVVFAFKSHWESIKANKNGWFAFGKEDETHYKLRLAHALNMDAPIRKIDICKLVTDGMVKEKWANALVKDMQVAWVRFKKEEKEE